MLARTRIPVVLALWLSMLALSTTPGKGQFAFLIVSGGSPKSEMLITDPALTESFFGFTVFGSSKTSAPGNPGAGYAVTRCYVDQGRRQDFDHLHYYPDSGYVYYDGIFNGWSDSDGKWYKANPGIKAIFEQDVLAASMREALLRLPLIRKS